MSFFERLQKNGVESHMLRTQYRMHPMIRKLPSDLFYEGNLLDGENVIL